MRLLLDTHIWLWHLSGQKRVSLRVVAELENSHNELWLSPISVWELALLCEKRRIVLSEDVATWIENAMRTLPLSEAPVTHAVALETRRVVLPHRDPADRFLVATARVFDLTLVTADERLFKAPGISVLVNR